MTSRRKALLGIAATIGVLWSVWGLELPTRRIPWEPPGCYEVSTGPRSKWLPAFLLRAAPPITDSTTARFAFVQDERDVFANDWGASFVADSSRGYGRQAAWTRADSLETRLRFFDVDWGWNMKLTSPGKDTLNGRVSFYLDDLLPLRARVHAVRISCQTAYVHTASGLAYHVLRPGGSDSATVGANVTIHEVTSLTNGTVIFNSRADSTPVAFQLGANQVIKGVEEGVTGMRVGEMRRLIVPPSLSVRSSYPANTPRDSTLVITVELLSVKLP